MDERLYAIKGGRAAHTREKMVAFSARQFVIMADESKFVPKLTWPVPVEALPFPLRLEERRLSELGGKPASDGQDEGRSGDHRQRQPHPGCKLLDD